MIAGVWVGMIISSAIILTRNYTLLMVGVFVLYRNGRKGYPCW